MDDLQIYLEDYIKLVEETNQFSPDEVILSAKMGLFGEVGSFLSIYKKIARGENLDSLKSKSKVIEELGDIFWYFTLLCIKSNIDFTKLISNNAILALDNSEKLYLISDYPSVPFVQVIKNDVQTDTINTLKLLKFSEHLLQIIKAPEKDLETAVTKFFNEYLSIIERENISLKQIVAANIFKIKDRFISIKELDLSSYEFDKDFHKDESFPRNFKIEFVTKANGKSYMKLNNVFIGDALNDNHKDNDGYKYHDVFHLAFATVLHWSPTFRALIKHKRKSNPRIDETEDSGRAIVTEEGLSAWLFAKHKLDNIDLTDKKNITYDMLKTIREFVHGYEVERCPLQLWESAITQGYQVFKDLATYQGGVVECNLHTRTITYHREMPKTKFPIITLWVND